MGILVSFSQGQGIDVSLKGRGAVAFNSPGSIAQHNTSHDVLYTWEESGRGSVIR